MKVSQPLLQSTKLVASIASVIRLTTFYETYYVNDKAVFLFVSGLNKQRAYQVMNASVQYNPFFQAYLSWS